VTLPSTAALRTLPLWTGYALLGLAVAITALGRHGARLMNGALLGAGAFLAALYGLRGVGHEWLPGLSAIVLGGGLAVLGLAHLAAGTGLVTAAIFGPLGWLGARALHMEWEVPTGAAVVIGFCFGVINRRGLSLILPPIVAGVSVVAGVGRLWKPAWPDEAKSAAAAVLAIALLVVSVERNHRSKRRKAARAKSDADARLKAKVTAQQAAFRRSQGGSA
jgi:hypothetical protein